ncbi:threonine-phosphate decarboxylase [Novosphingobium sp. JCM 18896]|uniref:threonine-phosphate decarboxylase n=1 Tax=Novosphingobium sp. JCM 18896 TaxID=2989731 RepID=UPI002222B2F5|nr:threonine-phosphate decarboxylase [Novosphingobium sp. JCM 18896]MCW1427482.1 pyridoxal phosphate-dependent class II aminotransferase [Novosphingobium sp. JCM 18896]
MTRWTWHGGGLAAARAHFGEGDAPWLDLSTGINPNPWPVPADLAIDWQALPDEAGLAALERAAADHFGADPQHVCALPGTEIGLRMAGDVLPGPAVHLAPTYRTHGDMFGGSRPVTLAEAGDETLIVANPRNPDGATYAADDLLAHRGWLVIDEAFADGSPELSLADRVADDRRLVIFRSFGKFFGLAGLRLGFVIAPRAVIARFRARLGAWPVAAAGIAIGTAAYRDDAWITASRADLPCRAAALDTVLARHGLAARGNCPLFRLVETDQAEALFERLARRAILTRPFDYDPRWLRLGLPGNDADLARLDTALG